MITAIIVAGGTGSRFGGEVPKTYRRLNGKPVLWHSVRAFTQHPQVDEVMVVHHVDHGDYLVPILAKFPEVRTVIGGETRQQSVRNGLEAVEKADKVLIHDAARPMVSEAVISQVITSPEKAALPVVPVRFTLAVAWSMAQRWLAESRPEKGARQQRDCLFSIPSWKLSMKRVPMQQ